MIRNYENDKIVKIIKTGIAGIILILLPVQILPTAFAGGKLQVGWSQSEMIESLGITNNWHYTTMGCMFWQLLYDQVWLFGPGPEYDFVPRAFVAFETDNRLKWRMKLRDGMKWHDGKPVTLKDAVFTWQHLKHTDPIWDYWDCDWKEGSLAIIDDHTVEFELNKKLGSKYPPFNFYPILPMHLWKRHKYDMEKFKNKNAIGSGPFKLKDFKANLYIIFEKFEDYWDDSPRADSIVFKCYGSPDAQNMALRQGAIDMLGYYGISYMAKPFLEKNPDIEVIETQGIGLDWMTFNLHPDGPLRDVTVRKAIAHGINKDKIIQMVYFGHATAQNTFVYPELAEYTPSKLVYDYNPENSIKMLQEAGYEDPDGDGIRNDPKSGEKLRFKLMTISESAEYMKMALLIREMMKPIGIEMVIDTTDLETYYDLYYYPAGNSFDIALAGEEPGPYADWIWEFIRSIDGGGEGYNTAYYNNPETDALMDDLYSEDDIEKRKELVGQLQDIMLRDLPHYVLVRPNHLSPVRTDKLQGFETRYMGGAANWINPWSFFNVHAK
ncbi:MAG: peptide ABC transporter substrate-binding protein [Desulfobacterales bacterium]|nr:peptide ABC transporter substrate-binding protein [Desulfobacterales bacterium]